MFQIVFRALITRTLAFRRLDYRVLELVRKTRLIEGANGGGDQMHPRPPIGQMEELAQRFAKLIASVELDMMGQCDPTID